MTVLNFGATIDFGAKGNINDFDPVGFSNHPDATSRWSDTSIAQLRFQLPLLRHDIIFTVEVFPFLATGQILQQECWIYFNGLFVHYRTIKKHTEIAFTILRDLVNPRSNQLMFVLPDATSPIDLGLGNDFRMLGLGFVKLSVGAPNAAAIPISDDSAAARTAAAK